MMPADPDACAHNGCFLHRCVDQSSPFCFPHLVVEAAQAGLRIVNQTHFDECARRGFKHFAMGFVIARRLSNGFHYAIPPWAWARRN